MTAKPAKHAKPVAIYDNRPVASLQTFRTLTTGAWFIVDGDGHLWVKTSSDPPSAFNLNLNEDAYIDPMQSVTPVNVVIRIESNVKATP